MKCPHCLTSFHDDWHESNLVHNSTRNYSHSVRWQICPSPLCSKTIIELGHVDYKGPVAKQSNRLVYPKAESRIPIPKEVDDENLIADYEEACAVLQDSAKASAALSRRAMQHILREKAGTTSKDLNDQIDEVIASDKLPTTLGENLNYVRVVGNFAAHPIKGKSTGEIVDIEPGEAEWNLGVLEELMDHYYVKPARAKKQRVDMNVKLKEAGKPELPV